MPSQTATICVHCGYPIVFQPYYLDGKEPNPPIWWHPWPDRMGGLGGGVGCCTRAADWPRDSWPQATPSDAGVEEGASGT